jgi:tetratricopeptide (TPR) repeat protein
MKGVIYVILIMAFSTKLFAQESCTEKLYKANNLYEKGQITEAIDIANSCANITNSKSEQWQAYRLLAMAYLVNNQTTEARKAAEKMLDLNPTYKPSYLKDPIELINLLKSVKIIPKFSIGMAATIGLNFTMPRITGIYNGANASKVYTTKNNWQAGIMLGYNFNEITSLHSGLLATSKNYDIKYRFEDIGSISVNEQMTYLDMPLSGRFTSKPVNGFRFFADAGAFCRKVYFWSK